ncbi:MAG: DUF2283 domain-containing protein [Cyanosarcina radialis HA8281-LM2]|jgi:uncharacterized protein YuzE|nr:DUF2283 domain-containing protein [Cyanosarcina radialis HA8281-LM2]
MKVMYDAETDILRIVLNDAPIEESNEDSSGIILDYDKAGNVIGLEVLSASIRVKDPRSLEHIVTG